MKKIMIGAVLLAISLIGIVWVGVWSLSFTEPSNTDVSIDSMESAASQLPVESTEKDTEESMASSMPDSSAQDDDFWEVSIIPPTITEEKKVTWVFSEVATFFIEEQGGDPAYIVNWIFDAVEKYGYELIIDVDPNLYLTE